MLNLTNNMRKIFFVFSIILSILFINFASADISCSPECNIKGTIVSVNFTEMYYFPCALTNCSGKVPDPLCCGFDIMPAQPAGYFLKIKISEVTPINEPCIKSYNCENLFSKGTEQVIFISKDKVTAGDSFAPDQKIQGEVSAIWGKSFDLYTLEDNVAECTINSDCYPTGVEPGTDGGLFYNCIDGKCHEGSAQRIFPLTNNVKIWWYVIVAIALMVLLILIIYFLRKNKK
jgi:hypothetical protein